MFGGDGEELDVYLLGVDVPVKEYTARIIELFIAITMWKINWSPHLKISISIKTKFQNQSVLRNNTMKVKLNCVTNG